MQKLPRPHWLAHATAGPAGWPVFYFFSAAGSQLFTSTVRLPRGP